MNNLKNLDANIFGTDGVRNKVGSYPFTVEDLPGFAKAIAMWAKEKYQNNIGVIIAQDTRVSCSWIKSILKAQLLANNIEVYDCQVLPIASLYHFMKSDKKYKFGIMISASHNPYHDNGIKIIDVNKKISDIDELKITSFLNSRDNSQAIDYQKIAQERYLVDAKSNYVELVSSLFDPNLLKNLKIVLDAANGANYEVAPIIFQKLGADVITINNQPNGTNINNNCGSTHISSLQKAVVKHSADIGFAFDGDGDRVIAVNSFGEIKDGDDILAILSNHPEYKTCKTIVGTVMSNKGLEDYLTSQGKKFERSSVGDKHVLSGMQKNGTILGGEQSGHILLQDIINTCDAIIVSLRVIESLKANNNWQMQTFDRYPQKLVNLPVKEKRDLNSPTIKKSIDSLQNKLKNGRILIRYSGTENYLRIMTESHDLEKIEPAILEFIKVIESYCI